jgi:phage gpG-like protein
MVELFDPFGPALGRAAQTAVSTFEKAIGRSAATVQRNATLGIRRQKYSGLWPALSEAYAVRKALKGHGNALLISEGDLSGSIEMSRRSAVTYDVGTNMVYARAHELGYEARGIPARPFMGPALEESVPEIKEHFRDAVQGLFS